jgi:hypothetical protein
MEEIEVKIEISSIGWGYSGRAGSLRQGSEK